MPAAFKEFLSAAMVATLLVGCGNSNEPASSGTAAPADTQQATPADTAGTSQNAQGDAMHPDKQWKLNRKNNHK